MSAKEMFLKMGWSYEYVKGDCSEDTIQCKDLTRTMILTCQNDLKNMLDDENDIFSVVRVKDVLQKYKSIIGVEK